jgi:hypothetical protein
MVCLCKGRCEHEPQLSGKPDAAADILQRYTSDQDGILCRLATSELARLTNTATG